ncbi:MAG TPA: hypothetical protein VK525_04625 [Candidatus Saccharimonadales bacterium]|nr:hypothetical protein [Candidatus Saccharimonadales bacterium]
MRFRTVLSLATMFLFCFTIAAWSSPMTSNFTAPPASAENQSISGKISSIGDASFAVDIMKDQNISTVQFLVDGSTKVEGKLSIGAQATVEYRSEGGKNLAVHVIVAPGPRN